MFVYSAWLCIQSFFQYTYWTCWIHVLHSILAFNLEAPLLLAQFELGHRTHQSPRSILAFTPIHCALRDGEQCIHKPCLWLSKGIWIECSSGSWCSWSSTTPYSLCQKPKTSTETEYIAWMWTDSTDSDIHAEHENKLTLTETIFFFFFAFSSFMILSPLEGN